jgi:hypothetical protein
MSERFSNMQGFQNPESSGEGVVTVGDLREFLRTNEISDELPVVIGGRDFDTAARTSVGLADEIWSDDQGLFGGRLCIGAMRLGLVWEES